MSGPTPPRTEEEWRRETREVVGRVLWKFRTGLRAMELELESGFILQAARGISIMLGQLAPFEEWITEAVRAEEARKEQEVHERRTG